MAAAVLSKLTTEPAPEASVCAALAATATEPPTADAVLRTPTSAPAPSPRTVLVLAASAPDPPAADAELEADTSAPSAAVTGSQLMARALELPSATAVFETLTLVEVPLPRVEMAAVPVLMAVALDPPVAFADWNVAADAPAPRAVVPRSMTMAVESSLA